MLANMLYNISRRCEFVGNHVTLNLYTRVDQVFPSAGSGPEAKE